MAKCKALMGSAVKVLKHIYFNSPTLWHICNQFFCVACRNICFFICVKYFIKDCCIVCRAGGQYKHGAVTVFGLNISPSDTTHLVFNDSVLRQQPIDVYMLTPYDGILSKYAVTSI